ncbi:hypothetical protein DM793_03275 [Paenarthrobacter nitroguajacolicus]|nr:hypothetical protein [Paenarthrobacter nitroguajacolicus]
MNASPTPEAAGPQNGGLQVRFTSGQDQEQPVTEASPAQHTQDTGQEPEYQGEYGGNLSAVLSAVIPLMIGIGCIIAALQLPLGTASKPGAGMWPLICGACTIVASTALLFFCRRIEHPEKFTRNIWAVGVGVASLAAFAALMPLLGFEVPLVLLVFLWLKVLGNENWRTSIFVALGTTAGFYLLFILGLKLTIPHLI